MKKLLLSAAVVTLFFTSCGPSDADAVTYNDAFVSVVDKFRISQESFIGQLDGHNNDSLMIAYKYTHETAKSCIDQSKALKPFDGDTALKIAAVKYFEGMEKLLANEGAEMITLLTKEEENINPDDQSKMQVVVGKYEAEADGGFKELATAQDAFSRKHNITLKERQ